MRSTNSWQDVERLKSEGRYRHAGQLAALRGYDEGMGCHFGLRSELERARAEFRYGWAEVTLLFKHRVRTEYWAKPIPNYNFDWAAFTDNYEPGCPIGHGATEEAAIEDLIEKLEER